MPVRIHAAGLMCRNQKLGLLPAPYEERETHSRDARADQGSDKYQSQTMPVRCAPCDSPTDSVDKSSSRLSVAVRTCRGRFSARPKGRICSRWRAARVTSLESVRAAPKRSSCFRRFDKETESTPQFA